MYKLLDWKYIMEWWFFSRHNRLNFIATKSDDIEIAYLPGREISAHQRVHGIGVTMKCIPFIWWLHQFDAFSSRDKRTYRWIVQIDLFRFEVDCIGIVGCLENEVLTTSVKNTHSGWKYGIKCCKSHLKVTMNVRDFLKANRKFTISQIVHGLDFIFRSRFYQCWYKYWRIVIVDCDTKK